MSEKSKKREISFVRDCKLKVGDYKEKSGLIKDGLYSWHLFDDNKTYAIESAYENRMHEMRIESRHMLVFDYHCKSIISIDGFFYNKFDCEEFEWVEQIYDTNYYICRKKEMYGVIDGEKNVIVDIVYPLVTRLPQIVDIDIDELFWYDPPHVRGDRKKELENNTKPYIILKITTYDGEYLLELTTKHKSKMYGKIYTFGKNYLIKNKKHYGLLSCMGEEIVPPIYSKAYPFDKSLNDWSIDDRYRTGGWIQVEINDRRIPIANNGKYYGEVPIEYEDCTRLERHYYKVSKNNKKGVLCMGLNGLIEIIPVKFIDVVLDPYQPFNSPFAIVQVSKGYRLFSMRTKEVDSETYQSLCFTFNIGLCRIEDYRKLSGYSPFIIAKKRGKYALLSQKGVPLTKFEFQLIEPMCNNVFPVCKDDLWGIIGKHGEILIECRWKKIVSISSSKITLESNGEEHSIHLNDVITGYKETSVSTWERPTYNKYIGSYSQDEMGYSDDDIDTIFDGDPSAYWNID